MNIVSESVPKGTTHFLRYDSGYIVWCKIDEDQKNQLVLSEWDSGNEYWVPGIFPVEHYQKIGLTSIDDLPTQNDVCQDASAPKGATHRYQHGGETSWYRETEDGLFVWRDGSWYASTQKSASELAKICQFGAVTTLAQDVQFADDIKEALTWLARNVHEWPKCIIDGEHRDTLLWIEPSKGDVKAAFSSDPLHCFTRNQWLARRAELQNKPSWKDAPEWAEWMAQHNTGFWCWGSGEAKQGGNGIWYSPWLGTSERSEMAGEVIGDWRDTLERRPAKTASKPVIDWSLAPEGTTHHIGGNALQYPWHNQHFSHVRYWDSSNGKWVKRSSFRTVKEAKGKGFVVTETPRNLSERAVIARLTEATENVLAAAPELMTDKYKFDPLTSIEDNQEQKMQQDNGWFERGELPPAGTWCEFRNSDDEWTDWHHCVFVGKDAHGAGVISIIGDDAGMLYRSANPKDFRPIRTDREKLTSLINGGMLELVKPEDIADAIIAAGFKRDGGAA